MCALQLSLLLQNSNYQYETHMHAASPLLAPPAPSQVRDKTLAARKDSNRAAQKVSPEAGVPPGTTWEVVRHG